jgi:hypothetical protein
MISRFLYIGYYLRTMNWPQLRSFQRYVQQEAGMPIIYQWVLCLYHSLRYNISILEYYQFGFWKRDIDHKETWAGTGFMYEYQLKMNPRAYRHILDDKVSFKMAYQTYVKHSVASLQELLDDPSLHEYFIRQPKLVMKESRGKCGLGTHIFEPKDLPVNEITGFMKSNGFDLVEEYIVQHPLLELLSPSAVNTVRIITQIDNNGDVHIMGCRLRVSVNSSVDNMAAGNLVATIDEVTGIVIGPGYFSDITKTPVHIHPITGVPIVGFCIPHWKDCLDLAKKVALHHPENRSVGWDIAIMGNEPDLIEGNHDWCKLVWQMPVNKGLKPTLEPYVS